MPDNPYYNLLNVLSNFTQNYEQINSGAEKAKQREL